MNIRHININAISSDNILTKRMIFATKKTICFILNLRPGQILPSQKNENSGLIFHVLSGSGEIQINEEIAKVTTGSIGYANEQADLSIPIVTEALAIFMIIYLNPSDNNIRRSKLTIQGF